MDYGLAISTLGQAFQDAELSYRTQVSPDVSRSLIKAVDLLFSSNTQSYREVLLGCCLAAIVDESTDVRRPYKNQGDRAFNGRTLDEKVINPFLHERMVPCSKGPFLAVFRRSVELIPETASGLRDKIGYTAMMECLTEIEQGSPASRAKILEFLLRRFIALRDAADIPLLRMSRLSLEQYRELLDKLLQIPSGGLIPVLLVEAMLRTLKNCFSLAWEVESQGINVADRASGASGDITVRQNDRILLAIEVTERAINKSRVVSTFNTKILENGIEDYLFVYSNSAPDEYAREIAKGYFSQGHEINFLQINEWIINNLATIGLKCRSCFTEEVLNLLENRDIPASVKVAWNDSLKTIVNS